MIMNIFSLWKVFSKRDVINALTEGGFSKDVAQVVSDVKFKSHISMVYFEVWMVKSMMNRASVYFPPSFPLFSPFLVLAWSFAVKIILLVISKTLLNFWWCCSCLWDMVFPDHNIASLNVQYFYWATWQMLCG